MTSEAIALFEPRGNGLRCPPRASSLFSAFFFSFFLFLFYSSSGASINQQLDSKRQSGLFLLLLNSCPKSLETKLIIRSLFLLVNNFTSHLPTTTPFSSSSYHPQSNRLAIVLYLLSHHQFPLCHIST
jgi:hypothetical protein